MTRLIVESTEQIGRSAERVLEAWVEPARMAGYFISSSSGPMAAGETVRWSFDDFAGGVEHDVEVHEVEPRQLSFSWSATGAPTRVTVTLKPNAANNVTRVTVREEGWEPTAEGIASYGQQVRGWTHMLCCLKAYLEYEQINLRAVASTPARGLFELHVERTMSAAPAAIYQAWTEKWDGWFAEPGTVTMRAEAGAPFRFEAVNEAGEHFPHFGRFLRLEQPDEGPWIVEHSWVTAVTRGQETTITIELEPQGEGTQLRLGHTGFVDTASRDAHEAAWPHVLAHLDACLTEG